MKNWWDVLTGPSVYRANTPWSPAAAIGAITLIVSVQLTLPLVLYWLSPELYQAISGEARQPKLWLQSGSASLGLIQQIAAGCLLWFAAGLGNGTRRAVLSLRPLKEQRAYTYVALALLAFSGMVAAEVLWQGVLYSSMGLLSVTGSNSNSSWMIVPMVVIASPLVEEFIYRGFLLSALAKSRIGFWGAAIFTDAAWTAEHAFHQSWNALPPIFVFGLLVSFLLWRTGNLWTCIFAHMTVNAERLLIQAVFALVLR
jgi:membrane protease YdiL (CAAX protease family)